MDEEQKKKRIDKTSSVIKELTAMQVDVKSFKPGDLVIPLLFLVVLILLSIFVYIPMISEATKNNAESKSIDNKLEQLEKLDKTITGMDIGQMQIDLSNSRLVIPYSLQVSDFIYNIDKQSLDSGLKPKDLIAGDIQVTDSTVKSKKNTPTSIKGVSGPVKYSGSLENISKFLDMLVVSSQYIISLDNIRLKKEYAGQSWEIALSVTGYYLNKESIVTPSYFVNFSPYTSYKDVYEKFNSKVQQNEK